MPKPAYLYLFEDAHFDTLRHELKVGGEAVRSQPRLLALLAQLLATPREVVSKDRLLAGTWGRRVVEEAAIANAVSKLRKALGPRAGARIVTVPGVGYVYDGDVRRVAAGRALASALALAAGLPVPGRAGHRLVRQLGASGRSETWLAEQPKTGDRRVFKFALDGERLASLKRERTVSLTLRAALGDRPDVVRVLDDNFVDAPYWLECDYGGEDLDRWSADPVRAPLRALALPQRLALAQQLIDAIAAAHAVKVVHADLKPANVLVAPAPHAAPGGVPWRLRVADFGSGRVLDPALVERLRVTRLGLTLDATDSSSGTPYYIAPELLTGAPATEASDVFSLGVMLYQFVAADLRRPLAPGWERDVDDDLLRADIAAATDMDPARRPPDAIALAETLRRLSLRRAERDAARVAQAAQQELARVQAAARRNEAVQALNRLLIDDLIGAANPSQQGRADVTVAEALTGAAARIDDKYRELDAAVRGRLHAAMQRALGELSRSQEAVPAGRRAVAALATAQRAATDDDDRADLATDLQDARLRLALDLVQMSKLDEAGEVVRAIDAAAASSATQAPLFRARVLYVKSWLTAGDLSIHASLAQLEEAAALLGGVPDADAAVHNAIFFALADNLAMVGRYADAEVRYRQLLDVQRARYGMDHPRPNYTCVGLANALARQGRYDEARALLQPAAERLAQTLTPAHRQTLTALDMLADVRFGQGDLAGAAADWARVQAGYAALLGEGSSYTLTVQTNRARALLGVGDAAGADGLLADALRKAREFLPADAPQVQEIRCARAACLLDLERVHDARALLDGLDAAALALARPEEDWSSVLAALAARCADAR